MREENEVKRVEFKEVIKMGIKKGCTKVQE